MIQKISYIELHSDNPEKALRFYSALFNVPLENLEEEGGGLELGDAYFAVIKTPSEPALPEFGVDVDRLEPYVRRLRSQGVETEGPTEIESNGKRFLQITFSDPDGRIVSLSQPLDSAKDTQDG